MTSQLLRNAIVGESVRDVTIEDSTIAAVGQDLAIDDGDAGDVEVVDLGGQVLLPSAVEPHTHLDKAFLANLVPNPTGDLDGAVAAMREAYERVSVTDTARRAERAIRMFAANGATTIRTHVDITEAGSLEPLRGVLDARQRCLDVADVEIVALCGFPVLGPEGSAQRSLLHEAMDMGADLVGGCPHLELDGPRRDVTEFLLGVAADRKVGVDLHTDEALDPGMLCLLDLVRAVEDGFSHRVTASHSVSLSMLPPARQQEIAERLAATSIGIVALPQTNLYLQGRGTTQAVPRGITPVSTLLAAGVAVAAGQDNVQDPFNPLGRACPLETASLMVAAAHLTPEVAYDTVSNGGRRVLGLEPVSLVAGSTADLVAVPVTSLREAIALGPPGRLVWRRGVRIR